MCWRAARLLRHGARWRVPGLGARVPRGSARPFSPSAQAVWSAVLVLSGTLSQLVEYTGFAVVLFSGVAVLSLFILRHREPAAHRPYRALGYPVAPALFVIASFAMVINQIVSAPGVSLIGLIVISAGLPLYWLFRRFNR